MSIITPPIRLCDTVVSVIIPSYNRAETVGQTIDSILNQKCNFKFEIVIGDDCSTDNAREVLHSYHERFPNIIKIILHEQNIGLGANWAICVKECRGKYIANCDNDDFWHNPNKLQLQVDFMESNPLCGVCHTDSRLLDRNTGRIVDRIGYDHDLCFPNNAIELQKKLYNGKIAIFNATVLYRANILRKYLNLDDYVSKKFNLQDWNTLVILARYTQFCCLHISTATACIETVSITRPKDFESVFNKCTRERETIKYISCLFPEEFPFSDNGYDAYINDRLLGFAYNTKDYKRAKEIALKSANSSLRIKCARNKVFFILYCFVKNIRSKIKFNKWMIILLIPLF